MGVVFVELVSKITFGLRIGIFETSFVAKNLK